MNSLKNKLSNTPFDGVIFDCDSTLSTIEGIDELADLAGVKAQVAQLTEQAMDGKIALEAIYTKRLELIRPTRQNIQHISQCYLDNIVPGAKEIIDALHQLQIKVAIISGGLYQAIEPLAQYLGVNKENVFAVHLAFDKQNTYSHVIPTPLTTANGKYKITADWKKQHQLHNVALIGDGVSDIAALGAADVVIGYGGVVSRHAVKQSATYFYEQLDLRGLLSLLSPNNTQVN